MGVVCVLGIVGTCMWCCNIIQLRAELMQRTAAPHTAANKHFFRNCLLPCHALLPHTPYAVLCRAVLVPGEGLTTLPDGRRVSSRVHRKPLEWYRNERLEYARQHKSRSHTASSSEARQEIAAAVNMPWQLLTDTSQ